MEFTKHLFNLNNRKLFPNDFNMDHPIKTLFSQIKLLEDINFSPLPHSKGDKTCNKGKLTNSLIKIIVSLNNVFLDKLKKKKSSKFFEINHYWNILLRHFGNKDSVKFIQNYFSDNSDIKEKGLAWLCIEIYEKNLHEFLIDIYKSGLALYINY